MPTAHFEFRPRAITNDFSPIHLMLALERDICSVHPLGPLYRQSIAVALITELFGRSDRPIGSNDSRMTLPPKHIARAVDYINSHPDTDLTLTTLAKMFGIGVEHFLRAFKRSTGLSPHQYILRSRIEHAKQLLARSNRPINQIAIASGFADSASFGRTFRRLVGCTPTVFREDFRRSSFDL